MAGSQSGPVVPTSAMHGPGDRPGGLGMITGVVMATASALAGLLVFTSVQQRSLRVRARQLEALASSDVLTGLHNRRLLDNLPACFGGRPTDVWVAYGDLDRFKQVNDDLGHRAGDVLLANIAAAIADAVRPDDLVCRMGGDEFVVLLRSCDESSAHQVLARIQRRLAELGLESVGGPVTISFGLCAVGPTLVTAEAIAEADRALMMAKKAGGNTVVLAPTLRWG
jgi:diguanylate cyclase (GGDEF)-like protein